MEGKMVLELKESEGEVGRWIGFAIIENYLQAPVIVVPVMVSK